MNYKTKIIVDTVCGYFGESPEQVFKVGRKRNYFDIRMYVYHLMRNNTHLSLDKIGKELSFYGHKFNHATVLHSLKKLSDLLDFDKKMKKDVETLERLVENNLKNDFNEIKKNVKEKVEQSETLEELMNAVFV